MRKREAFGAAKLLESQAEEVFPPGTEIDVARQGSEWGVQITAVEEGEPVRRVIYFEQVELERFLREYLDKLTSGEE